LSGRRPMLRIHADQEKGGQDRLLPIAPEFAEFLLNTPKAERVGRVFKLVVKQREAASRIVSEIGKAAGVKVASKAAGKSGAVKVKYASAPDLRRSFGERWAARVMPQILMQLMRHESIETTMKFYVGRNAETAADVLYAAVAGQPSLNTSPNT